MAEDSLDIGRLKDKIGVEWDIGAYEIEKGMIWRFVRAVDDPNPLWQNEEYAQRSKHKGIIAPPTFFLAVGFEQFIQQVLDLASFGTILMGSTDVECYQNVRPGDVVNVTTKIIGIREMPGKMGKTAFMTFVTSYKNHEQWIRIIL